MWKPQTVHLISSMGMRASPSIFQVPMKPRLRCRLSWTSSSDAWAQETLSISCWHRNSAKRKAGRCLSIENCNIERLGLNLRRLTGRTRCNECHRDDGPGEEPLLADFYGE